MLSELSVHMVCDAKPSTCLSFDQSQLLNCYTQLARAEDSLQQRMVSVWRRSSKQLVILDSVVQTFQLLWN